MTSRSWSIVMAALVVVLMLFAFSKCAAQIYLTPFSPVTGGELLKLSLSGDTMSLEPQSTRVMGYRLQGRYETWQQNGPNCLCWRDTLTGIVKKYCDQYADMHWFEIDNNEVITFIKNAPQDSVRHFEIQRIDKGLITGSWKSIDHMDPATGDSTLMSQTEQYLGMSNPFHPNSIADGLLSCRNNSTILKYNLNNTTSWTLTGTWEAQHAAQRLPDGSILLYDNGALRGYSRAIIIDNTGAVLWQYPKDSSRFGQVMGNVSISGSDTLICWGGTPGGMNHPEIEILHSTVSWSAGSGYNYQGWITNKLTVSSPTDLEYPHKWQVIGTWGPLRFESNGIETRKVYGN